MSRALTKATAAAAVTAAMAVLAGCGSATHPAAAAATHPASLPLATSLATSGATWTVVPMGAAAGPNLFWQLFVRPAGTTRWTLATPPDVATNGAIALAPRGGQSLVTGIHPSLLLGFSPVTSTTDAGHTWSSGTPDAGLASVPDALAAAPSGTGLVALDRDGRAELAGADPAGGGTAGWTVLTSTANLAATPAGRSCGLTALTAGAFTPAGSPVLAGTCHRPGVAGIFTSQGGTWQAAGPPLPVALRRQPVQVLRLTRTGGRLTAVLQAGTGHAATLRTAWLTGHTWTMSPALPLAGRAVLSTSFGSAGATAAVLTGRRAEFLAGPGASWRQLPQLPSSETVILALPSAAEVDALAAGGSTLTAWRLPAPGRAGTPGGKATADRAWIKTQTTKVPIQFGSSS